MTEEELKQKCKERAKIFQQAMESCKSSSPIDCIEWFADRIADLEKENAELRVQIEKMKRCEICKHYRWNHCSYEINISEDCIQNKLKHFELKEIKENE